MLRKLILFILVFSSVYACSSNVQYAKSRQDSTKKATSFYNGQIIKGESSYYGKKFHGRKTANGEVFDMYKLTAAHRTLPFNTIIQVRNLSNNKIVKVRINDRGPFAGHRILDLSYGAAKEIGLVQSGVAKVEIKILQMGD